MHLLSPGETALWVVGVTTRVASLDELEVRIHARDSAGTPALSKQLSVEIGGCTTTWADGECPIGATTIMSERRLTAAVDGAIDIRAEDGTVPRGVDLLLKVGLPESSADMPGLQGAQTEIIVTVDAAGVLGGKTGPMPNTGVRVGGYLLLSLAAVLFGGLICRLARDYRPTSSRYSR